MKDMKIRSPKLVLLKKSIEEYDIASTPDFSVKLCQMSFSCETKKYKYNEPSTIHGYMLEYISTSSLKTTVDCLILDGN